MISLLLLLLLLLPGGGDGTGSASLTDAEYTSLVPAPLMRHQALSSGFTAVIGGRAEVSGAANGARAHSTFSAPDGMAVDSQGNVYVADTDNHVIRCITATGDATTLAGVAGVAGDDDGVDGNARFRTPHGVTIDHTDTYLYVCDTENHRIRRIALATVTVTTLPVTGVYLYYPWKLQYVHRPGTHGTGLLVADRFNHRVLFVNITTSIVTTTTIAGNGTAGHTDGVGTASQLYFPSDVAHYDGRVYVAEDHCIRVIEWSPTTSTPSSTTTLAGVCTHAAYTDGMGDSARFYSPSAVHMNDKHRLFVAEQVTSRVRLINVTSRHVSTFAGASPGSAHGRIGDVRFLVPSGLAAHRTITNTTFMYVSDKENHQVFMISAICDPLTCAHNGTCVGMGVCECAAGYNGDLCAFATCVTPCTNGQECLEANVCGCVPGWSGASCATPVCASGCVHGVCSAPSQCTCDSGWNGTTCAEAVCPSPCQHTGTCIAPNTCNCTAQWTGVTCEDAVCTLPCQHNGTCSSPDTCACTANYTGVDCSQAVCTPTCANGGTCVSPGVCNCTTSFVGDRCEEPNCTPGCENGGVCVGPFTCACPSGYSGTHCLAAVCDVFCENGGVCSTPNNCTCVDGWTGSACVQPVCTPSCPSGTVCTLPNTCTSACFLGCKHNGTCVALDTCTCASGWKGADCGTADCIRQCYYGTCTGPNECTCIDTYGGENCTQPLCNPPCVNNGVCTAPDTCTCTGGWRGAECSTAYCNHKLDGCLHGTCTAPDVCTCDDGWIGGLCDRAVCTVPCENSATCIAPDTCGCLDGFTGPTCSEVAQSSVQFWERSSQYFYFAFACVTIIIVTFIAWMRRMAIDLKNLQEYGRGRHVNFDSKNHGAHDDNGDDGDTSDSEASSSSESEFESSRDGSLTDFNDTVFNAPPSPMANNIFPIPSDQQYHYS